MTLRDGLSTALLRAGGLCLVAAAVLVIVPALSDLDGEVVVADPGTDLVSATAAAPASGDGAARAALAAAASVTRSRAWSGTQLVSVFGPSPRSALVDVRHVPGVGSWLTVRPASGTSRSEEVFEPDLTTPPDGPAGSWLDLVDQHYAVATDVTRTTTPGGARASVLALTRADGSLAARFSVDRASGLIVGREVYDRAGRLLRTSTFTTIVPAVPGAPVASAHPVAATTASRADQQLGEASLAAWRARGWVIPARVDSDFSLVDARGSSSGPTDPAALLHLTYSDGLSTISVFAEHGRLDPSSMSGWRSARRAGWPVLQRSGVHDQDAWSDGTRVWSVVADAPAETVDAAIRVLPHRRGADAYSTRFTGGLARIGGWLDPFG